MSPAAMTVAGGRTRTDVVGGIVVTGGAVVVVVDVVVVSGVGVVGLVLSLQEAAASSRAQAEAAAHAPKLTLGTGFNMMPP
jgi:hypothetical protein